MMDQLAEGLSVSLTGSRAQEWVRRARAQVNAWGLELPEVEPLVLDFGLGDFLHIGEIEFWIANEVEAGYCGKFLFMFAGQTCPKHFHREKLETFFVVRGEIGMRYDGRETILRAGSVLRMEPGVSHEFTAASPSLLLEVSKPSIVADNYFENPAIPIGAKAARTRKRS